MARQALLCAAAALVCLFGVCGVAQAQLIIPGGGEGPSGPILPVAEPEFFIILSFLQANNFTLFADALNTVSGLRSIVLQNLLPPSTTKFTILAPTDDALNALADRKKLPPNYCLKESQAVDSQTLESSLGMHIIPKYYTNDDLVALPYNTPLPTLTGATVAALPGFATSPVGSIQIGVLNGVQNVKGFVTINEIDVYVSSRVTIQSVDGVLQYPVLNSLY